MIRANDTPAIIAIVNVTRDSFSPSTRYLDPDDAARRVRKFLGDGAEYVELGAESTHPDSEDVSATDEISRLGAVLDRVPELTARIGIDTHKAEVQRFGLQRNVAFLNDVRGFPDAAMYPELAAASCTLVVMHQIAGRARASRQSRTGETVPDADLPAAIASYLRNRCGSLIDAGVGRARIVADPGMGFFLGAAPETSLVVLRNLSVLRAALDLPVLVSVSRKSFLGAITESDISDRGAATLSAELFAAEQGVDFIRTHDASALRDALMVRRRLRD